MHLRRCLAIGIHFIKKIALAACMEFYKHAIKNLAIQFETIIK